MRLGSVLVCLAFAAIACEAPPPPVSISDVAVERDAQGVVSVRWRASVEEAPVDVYIAAREGEPRLISDDDRDGVHVLRAEEAAQRPVLRLVSQTGDTQTVAERVLPLQGGRNFRDLGGYPTSDGRVVRWGTVFRSGTMTGLTTQDFALLRRLGVSTICDFRSTEERAAEPTDWRSIDPDLVYQTRDYTSSSSRLREALERSANPSPAQVAEAMTALYGELAYEHADSYKTMFRDIVENRLPLAFNCSAGKDRTGVGAALLLTALGVPREIILEDYALSERVVNYEAAYGGRPAATPAPNRAYSWIARLSPEQRAPLMRSDPAYLTAAFAAIEARSGSVDAYLRETLGLSDADLQAVRERLLEAGPRAVSPG